MCTFALAVLHPSATALFERCSCLKEAGFQLNASVVDVGTSLRTSATSDFLRTFPDVYVVIAVLIPHSFRAGVARGPSRP